MKILGIDTSTKFLCLGVADGSKLYEYNLELSTRLSSLLVPTIQRVLDSLGWKPADLDYFACGLGPGSFTGLRVGLAVIKGLAWPQHKPVVGISTLDILAKNISGGYDFVIPVIDAKRNLIYSSVYKNQGGQFKRIAPYMLLGQEGFLDRIKKTIPKNSRIVLLGDGINLCREKTLAQVKKAKLLDKDYWQLKARNIIFLAEDRIKAGKQSQASGINPIYLYPKECQIRNSNIENQKSNIKMT